MTTDIKRIDPQALRNSGTEASAIDLLDVRTPAEFEDMHVNGAVLMPLDRFQPERAMASFADRGVGIDSPLFLTCQSGVRASEAAAQLMDRGYSNVWVIDGGVPAMRRAGFPVTLGRATLSIERQVQIALGVMVLLKVGFGVAVHPLFLGLLALLGVGLALSGLTGNCMLAQLLSRMPWNRRPLPSLLNHRL